jgi:hypothetical protein
MRITVGRLRKLIAESLTQMKLGVAGGEGDARAWGKKPMPDEPDPYEPEKGGPTYIATEKPINLEPDEETKEAWRQHIQNMQKQGFDELERDGWEPWKKEKAGVVKGETMPYDLDEPF